MTDITMHMSCDDFAARLGDHLEGDAPLAVSEAMTAHAAECAGCGELLADLHAISVQAAALPVLQPSRDLWTGIAERIDARVLPLESPRTARVAMTRRSWVRPAAAAAALMVVTAGITYQLTKRTFATSVSVVATRDAGAGRAALHTGCRRRAHRSCRGTWGGDGTDVVASGNRPGGTARSSAGTGACGAVARAASVSPPRESWVRLASTDPLRDAEPVYDKEIAKLRTLMHERRDLLDPATVTVLEQSIAVIDSAIAQSRAALAKDPASGLLASQLSHSLEKKVELLRTAALLPSRT
jgi:hypothetical protein